MSFTIHKRDGSTMRSEPPYPDKFKAGDVAISKINCSFDDRTRHQIGEEIGVTEKNKHYFNVWHQFYEKK